MLRRKAAKVPDGCKRDNNLSHRMRKGEKRGKCVFVYVIELTKYNRVFRFIWTKE